MAFISKETKEYINEIKNLEKTYNEFLNKFLTEMALRCMARTKQRTPVDTGNLRNQWKISEVKRPSKDKLFIYIYNPVKYASFVEYGHRQEVGRYVPAIQKRLVNPWVDGYFMATVSISEIEKEIPRKYEQAFKEFLAGKNKYLK